ncbi:MAG: O-antigen ligase family protein [Roseibium sp.]|uniref:O-antigen ligase family protein n=1 Tax=Roseibium sp. TaxID=1936156 RepID=UPI0026143A0B|nr:O-antigen ligase family protein [Roseibium sp.]MCV0428497.1 O-antigen ligase family protein [Roseibium sp.]
MSGQFSMALELLRYIVGALAFSIFFLVDDFQLKRRQWLCVWLVSCVAALWIFIASFTGEPLIVGNKPRLASFSGGADGLHPSAYITLALLWMHIQLLRRGVGYRTVTLGMIALLLAVLFGYEVRTTYVVAIAMIGFSLARALKLSPSIMLLLAVLSVMIGLPAVVLLASGIPDLDLSKFSSGRVVAWGERIDIILDRGLFQFLFGSGPGTDYFKGNATWRYEAKDSHNDFLITTIEFGVLGLLAFLSFWASLIARGRGHVLSMLAIAFLLSSAISNGIINRPSVAPIFAFCTFLALCARPATAQKRTD